MPRKKKVPVLPIAPPVLVPEPEPPPVLPTSEEVVINSRVVGHIRLVRVRSDPNGIVEGRPGAVAQQKGKALWVCSGGKAWVLRKVKKPKEPKDKEPQEG